MKKRNLIIVCLLTVSCIAQSDKSDIALEKENQEEIFYHVFQRSFYDDNGDSHGDFSGLESKLDYLKDLGITSIILLPIYESPFYHNYFADDFRRIDPKYGTLEEFHSLVRAVHDRQMRIYLDMEVQYITENHKWFQGIVNDPDSPYKDYLLYKDKERTQFEAVIFDLEFLESYTGEKAKLASLNLYHPDVKAYIYNEFHYWLDPKGDGSLTNGVDGFRIDHMMDDMDWRGSIRSMFSEFWKPLFNELREINPGVRFIGEQANWSSYGLEYFTQADIDFMFAFPLKFAITEMNKENIVQQCEILKEHTPEGKRQLAFIENHDMDRFASEVNGNIAKLKVGAALNILISGLPVIYYGQEIGMEGSGGFNAYGLTDGNDIPRREAFQWTPIVNSEGTCLWYKNTGPWWNDSKLKDFSGISLQEQRREPNSIYNYYKKLLRIRSEHSAFGNGDLRFIENENNQVLSFLRLKDDQILMVHVNLTNEIQKIRTSGFQDRKYVNLVDDDERHTIIENFSLSPFEVMILKIY